MIAFGEPAWLALLLLAPLRVLGKRALLAPPSVGVSSDELFRSAEPGGRTRFLWVPEACLLGALACLVLSLARPRWERERVVVERPGREILLVVDLSSSMAEHGLDPDRTDLEVVKAAARRFVEHRPGDRLGLLTFARFPGLRVPFTSDHEALLQVLDRLECVPRGSELDGTALGAALAEAARRFEAARRGAGPSPLAERGGTVVLFTDGEENQYVVDPLAAALVCREAGVRVFTVAAAGEGASAGPAEGGGEGAGLRAGALRIHEEVARITGGAFACARAAAEVDEVRRRVEAAVAAAPQRRTVREGTELFPGFVLAAALLLCAAGVLSGTVLARFP